MVYRPSETMPLTSLSLSQAQHLMVPSFFAAHILILSRAGGTMTVLLVLLQG
jgi:hypothetical protein